jgi:hypothetical protein
MPHHLNGPDLVVGALILWHQQGAPGARRRRPAQEQEQEQQRTRCSSGRAAVGDALCHHFGE